MVMTVEEVEGVVVVEDSEGIWLNLLGTKSLYHLRDGGNKKIGRIVSRHHLRAIGNAIVTVIEIILAVVVVEEGLIGLVPGDLPFLLCRHAVITIVDLPTEIDTEVEVAAEEIVAAIEGVVATGIAIRHHHEIGNVEPANAAAVDGGVTVKVPIPQQHQYLLVVTTQLPQ